MGARLRLEGGSEILLGCSVLASSVDDATLEEFVTCMDDGQAGCGEVFGCAQLLPITF